MATVVDCVLGCTYKSLILRDYNTKFSGMNRIRELPLANPSSPGILKYRHFHLVSDHTNANILVYTTCIFEYASLQAH